MCRWTDLARTVSLPTGLLGGDTVGVTFGHAFRALSVQLDVAYLSTVSVSQMDAFDNQTSILRDCIGHLGAKCTPWVHVWLCHVPAFLRRWGTLHPFIGHGVEGRHRRMKREVATSTSGQWKGDQVGFAHALRRDCVWWNLLSNVRDPHTRPSVVNRRSALFQRFRDKSL